ncbi:12529_t:CDS:2 [Entrophospora sp. SA101]|nr:12529_t:CDS:2 [Entrophospora sp. SA101]
MSSIKLAETVYTQEQKKIMQTLETTLLAADSREKVTENLIQVQNIEIFNYPY